MNHAMGVHYPVQPRGLLPASNAWTVNHRHRRQNPFSLASEDSLAGVIRSYMLSTLSK